MRISSFVLTSSIVLTGCIWDPPSGTEHENTASVPMLGWVTAQNTQVDIKARNYATGTFDLITSVMSGTDDTFGDGMYSWSATLTSLQLPRNYWVPPSVGGNPAGRLELAGFMGTNQMYTFTEAAQTCTAAEMDNGETQQNAGTHCASGNTTVLFDNNGYGLGADATTSTTPVNKTVSGVNVKVISYLSQGNTVYAAICSPLSGTGRPIAIYNHGGSDGLNSPLGLPEYDTNLCVQWASNGWVFAMSTYRGETLRVPSTWSTSPTSWSSTGAIQTNLGEVNDAMRLLAIVQALPNVNRAHTLMWGGSHGGGITLRAVERGAKVQAAIASFPATDWVQLYNDCVTTTTSGPTTPEGQFCALVTSLLQTQTGGTPTSNVAAYNWRSPTYFSADLKLRPDVKILLQQGIADPIVRISQTCNFATQAGFPADTQWHVPNNLTPGSSVTGTVTGCPQAWKPTSRPIASWPANRYFMVYDGLGHAFLNDAMSADFINFANSFGW